MQRPGEREGEREVEGHSHAAAELVGHGGRAAAPPGARRRVIALRHGLAARVLLAQVLLELTLEPCAFAALLLRRLRRQGVLTLFEFAIRAVEVERVFALLALGDRLDVERRALQIERPVCDPLRPGGGEIHVAPNNVVQAAAAVEGRVLGGGDALAAPHRLHRDPAEVAIPVLRLTARNAVLAELRENAVAFRRRRGGRAAASRRQKNYLLGGGTHANEPLVVGDLEGVPFSLYHQGFVG